MNKTKISGWDGYTLTAGNISVGVVPQIGGRIISLAINNKELFFVQKEYAGETFDFSKTATLRAEKRRIGFRVWGGDKTWVAPQKDWWEGSPPIELDAGSYQESVKDNSITMVSAICRETGLQITEGRTDCLNLSVAQSGWQHSSAAGDGQ
jgi:hypothetical protein